VSGRAFLIPAGLRGWLERRGQRRELYAEDAVDPMSIRRRNMDKDRIKGSAEQAKGKVKEVAGKITGDSKTEAEGKTDQAKGKIQNTVGGIKDSLRGE
jgi:uncharacterized protein YjbJ (UPF0337 family)